MAKKKCACETRSGKKCKNYALQHTDYCSVHQDCEKNYKKKRAKSPKRKSGGKRSPHRAIPPPQYRCACLNKDGTRCKKYTVIGSSYCNVHTNCGAAAGGVQGVGGRGNFATLGLYNAALARSRMALVPSRLATGVLRAPAVAAGVRVPFDDSAYYPAAPNAGAGRAPAAAAGGVRVPFDDSAYYPAPPNAGGGARGAGGAVRAVLETPVAAVQTLAGSASAAVGGSAEDYDATYGQGDSGYGSPGRTMRPGLVGAVTDFLLGPREV